MARKTKFLFSIPLCLVLLVFMMFSMIGCNADKEEPIKANVKITIINQNELPITNTQISVTNISAAEIAYVYTTDSNGQFTIMNLGERELTFIIHSVEKTYTAKYAVSKADLEQGNITVQFSDITETTIEPLE